MKNNKVSPIHLFLSTTTGSLCILWSWDQPKNNIKMIILFQFAAIFVSLLADAPLRAKTIKYFRNKNNKLDSQEVIKLYFKIMFIGSSTVVLSYGLAVFFIDYENNPDNLLFAVSVITIFLIWLGHNWCVVKIHNTKL